MPGPGLTCQGARARQHCGLSRPRPACPSVTSPLHTTHAASDPARALRSCQLLPEQDGRSSQWRGAAVATPQPGDGGTGEREGGGGWATASKHIYRGRRPRGLPRGLLHHRLQVQTSLPRSRPPPAPMLQRPHPNSLS